MTLNFLDDVLAVNMGMKEIKEIPEYHYGKKPCVKTN